MTHLRRLTFKELGKLFLYSFKEWNEEDPWRLSAVVAFYAIFSLPALVIIVITVAGFFVGEDAVEGQISQQISGMIGQDASRQLEIMVANTHLRDQSFLDLAIGLATLLFGATSTFVQMQTSFNLVWGVERKPHAGIKKLVFDRLTSFGLILILGFLLLISLLLTSLISILAGWIRSIMPDFILPVMLVINFLFAFLMNTVLFTLLFKILPDIRVGWESVLIGGVITALLFELGKFGLSLYFGEAEPGSTFGAAGSIILILLWINYACLILFFGAHFAKVYAWRFGHKVEPNRNARWSAKFREEHKAEKLMK